MTFSKYFALFAFLFPITAHADFSLSLIGDGPTTVERGGIVFFNVTASRTGNPFSLQAFDFAFDVSPAAGFGSPAGFQSGITVINRQNGFDGGSVPDFLNASQLSQAGTVNFDFQVTGTALIPNPVNSPISLFTFRINTAAMGAGNYVLSFVNPTFDFVPFDPPVIALTGTGSPGTIAYNPSTFTITAVPEPSSIVFGGVIAAFGLLRLRKRRSKSRQLGTQLQ